MNRFITAAALAAFLSVSAGSAVAGDEKGKEGRQCTSEYVVGSHLPKRVCTTAAEREVLRKAAQERMTNLHMQSRAGGTRTSEH